MHTHNVRTRPKGIHVRLMSLLAEVVAAEMPFQYGKCCDSANIFDYANVSSWE